MCSVPILFKVCLIYFVYISGFLFHNGLSTDVQCLYTLNNHHFTVSIIYFVCVNSIENLFTVYNEQCAACEVNTVHPIEGDVGVHKSHGLFTMCNLYYIVNTNCNTLCALNTRLGSPFDERFSRCYNSTTYLPDIHTGLK